MDNARLTQLVTHVAGQDDGILSKALNVGEDYASKIKDFASAHPDAVATGAGALLGAGGGALAAPKHRLAGAAGGAAGGGALAYGLAVLRRMLTGPGALGGGPPLLPDTSAPDYVNDAIHEATRGATIPWAPAPEWGNVEGLPTLHEPVQPHLPERAPLPVGQHGNVEIKGRGGALSPNAQALATLAAGLQGGGGDGSVEGLP